MQVHEIHIKQGRFVEGSTLHTYELTDFLATNFGSRLALIDLPTNQPAGLILVQIPGPVYKRTELHTKPSLAYLSLERGWPLCVCPSGVSQAKLGGILVPNLVQGSPLGLYSIDYYSELCTAIGAKANLYCEAIELVCGGSPKICVLVERKSQHRVKSEG